MSDLTITAPAAAPAPPPVDPEVDAIRRALRDAIADLQRIPVAGYTTSIFLHCSNADEFFTRLAALEQLGEPSRSIDSATVTARLKLGTVGVLLTMDARDMPTRTELVEVPAWPEASRQ